MSTLIIGSLAKPFENAEEGWDCHNPVCNDDELLFPHYESDKFWQCIDSEDGWVAEVMSCPQLLYFSPANQACVWPDQAEEVVCLELEKNKV